MFDTNTQVSGAGFTSTFNYCIGLTGTIPADLFKYNTLVTISAFQWTFGYCAGLTGAIPSGLFDTNTLVAENGFLGTFNYCTGLESAPANLFRNNTLTEDQAFQETFYECNKLQLNRNIFYADGEQDTRFNNGLNHSFYYCFYRTSFTGTQGEAPDLWNCTFGGTLSKINCFAGAGNSLTSLWNYPCIPADWGGTGYDEEDCEALYPTTTTTTTTVEPTTTTTTTTP
jgi:hypothetical protein